MKIKNYILSLLTVALLFSFLSPKHAFAATFTLSGKVSDSVGTAISGATVNITDAITNANAGSTTTDNSGNYSILVSGGTYNVQAVPPIGSNFQSVIALNQIINNNTVLNFTLVPTSTTVMFSGRVVDAYGNGVPNQLVSLSGPDNPPAPSTTDSTGHYIITAAPGNYTVHVFASFNDPGYGLNVPEGYNIVSSSQLSLTQNTNLDLSLPVHKVTVHIQDAAGNPVSGANIITNDNSNPTLTLSSLPANGTSLINRNTDSSGNIVGWLFSGNYTFTATPPNGASLAINTYTGDIAADTTITITLPTAVNLSGRVLDPSGNGVPGQQVHLTGGPDANNPPATATTDSTGHYIISALPGNYTLTVYSSETSGINAEVPRRYQITTSTLTLSQNTTLDLTLPVKKVTLHVQDAAGNPISNVNVVTLNPPTISSLTLGGLSASGYSYANANTDTLGNVVEWLFPTDTSTTYDFEATPPSNSGYSTNTINNVTINSDTSLTITLASSVTFQGKVVDEYGNGVPNQTVSLGGVDNPPAPSTTDSNGNYFISASTGNYTLKVDGIYNDPNSGLNVPERYSIHTTGAISLTQNTNLNISLPFKKVTVHVQDQSGNPVANVDVSGGNGYDSSFMLGNLPSSGTSFADGKTDNSGNVIEWYLPTTVSINAIPPTGSIYTTFSLTNVSITSDQTEIISLQTNQPPTINPLSNVTLNEGDTYTANGSFTDADSTSWTATVDYGDGAGSQSLTLSGNNFSLNHQYRDNGIYTVTVKVTDNLGATGTGTATVTVNNVAPIVGVITAPSSPTLVNTAITASDTFTDPGVLDTHTASWNWGDGNTTTGTVTETNGSGSVSDTHTYTTPGVYTITLTVKDKDGGANAATYQYVAIYDVGTSFAGGKSYTSPAGAYLANTSITGKVSFGISAKYSSSNTLTGSVKMSFKDASLDFASSSLQYLVSSNGKAILKGTGTLNGSGTFSLLVSGIDGSVTGGQDMIRFQIKDANGNVIYDSQPGAGDTADPTTPVATGNIRVH